MLPHTDVVSLFHPVIRSFVLYCLFLFGAVAPLLAVAAKPPPKEAAINQRALIIGNGKYPSAPLKNPENDAHDVSSVLRTRGFLVTEGFNLSLVQMNEKIKQFSQTIQAGEIVVFYFAGHGMQVDGRNFLIPVDSAISSEKDVLAHGIDVAQVIERFARAGSKMNVVILDACRNNPFGSSKGAGLAAMDAPRGTLIAFATAPGKSAFDGEGRNGLYTKHLVANMPTEGLKIEDLMKRVRMGVAEESRGRQIPWENTSLTDDFYFTPGEGRLTALKGDVSERRVESQAAKEAAGSGVMQSMRHYLNRYPVGEHRVMVEAALITLIEKGPLRAAVAGTYTRDCPTCPELVELSNRGEAIGAFPVTVGQYQECVAAGYCSAIQSDEFGGGIRPATNLSLRDANRFLNWLSKKTSKKYRLPSEREWLSAAKQGLYVESSNGPKLLPQEPCENANGYDRTAAFVSPFPWKEESCHDGFPFTSPVGVFPPNSLGLYDMFGNVWQWTTSCASPDQVNKGSECKQYRLKGGSWASPRESLNINSELVAEPELAGNTFGFRVFRERR